MSADRTRSPKSSRTPLTQSKTRYHQCSSCFSAFPKPLVHSVMLGSDWSVGGEWDDSGYVILPHHIHLPLHLGDQRGILLPVYCALRPRWWRQSHYLWWLQRGVLLAQTQHTRGQWDLTWRWPSWTSFDSKRFCLSRITFVCLQDAKVMSWWDYGYQITAMANRTILVDNNTWNNTHISRVGQVRM